MEGYNHDFSASTERRHSPLILLAALAATTAIVLIFAQGLYDVAIGYTPYVFLAAVVWILTFMELRLGLGLMILAVALSPEYTLLGVPNIRMEDFVFPAVLLAWVSRTLYQKERLVPTDLKLPMIGLIVITVFSSLYNLIYMELPFTESFFRFGKGVEYYLMFLVTLNVVKTEKDITGFVHLMWAAALAVTVYTLVQLGRDPGMIRLHGVPGETANILGGYIVFHVCLLLGISSGAERGRLLFFLIAVAMAVPFVHTMSRASYVSILFGLLVLGLLTRDRSVLAFLIVTALLVAFTQARDRFETIFGIVNGNPPSAWQARIEGWKAFLPNVAEAPLLGWGVGRAPLAIDNEYVRLIYEQGIIGFLLFAVIVWRAGRSAMCVARSPETRRFRGFALGYVAGTAALLVHSITAVTFTAIRTTEPFFIATALIYGALALQPARQEIEPLEIPGTLRPLRMGSTPENRL